MPQFASHQFQSATRCQLFFFCLNDNNNVISTHFQLSAGFTVEPTNFQV